VVLITPGAGVVLGCHGGAVTGRGQHQARGRQSSKVPDSRAARSAGPPRADLLRPKRSWGQAGGPEKSWRQQSYTSCFLVRASQHRVTPCSSICLQVHNGNLHTAGALHCRSAYNRLLCAVTILW
jgi:hypothetical protein